MMMMMTPGCRYAALMFSSFVPVNVDIVTWEFAINDRGYKYDVPAASGDHATEDFGVHARFMFRQFMRQAELHPNRTCGLGFDTTQHACSCSFMVRLNQRCVGPSPPIY